MKNEANNINSENLNKINGQEFEYQANVLVGKDIIKETDFPKYLFLFLLLLLQLSHQRPQKLKV